MPKHFFKKYFPGRDKVLSNQFIQKFKHWLDDPNLWHINRHSVSWGLACGLFMAFMPIPLQMVFASMLAIVFRGNIPIAFAAVWITNPITMPPIFFFAYKLGATILETPVMEFSFEFSLAWLFEELGHKWRPFLLGCLISGSSAAVIGFFASHWFWRYYIIRRMRSKKRLLVSAIKKK